MLQDGEGSAISGHMPVTPAASAASRWLDRADHALGLLIEIPAALATAVEVALCCSA